LKLPAPWLVDPGRSRRRTGRRRGRSGSRRRWWRPGCRGALEDADREAGRVRWRVGRSGCRRSGRRRAALGRLARGVDQIEIGGSGRPACCSSRCQLERPAGPAASDGRSPGSGDGGAQGASFPVASSRELTMSWGAPLRSSSPLCPAGARPVAEGRGPGPTEIEGPVAARVPSAPGR